MEQKTEPSQPPQGFPTAPPKFPGPPPTFLSGKKSSTSTVPREPPRPRRHEELLRNEEDNKEEGLSNERNKVAEEALLDSLAHVVTEYVRQDLEQEGGGEGNGATTTKTAENEPELEFDPDCFAYNTQVSLLILVSLIGVWSLIQSTTLVAILLGGVAFYVADYLNFRQGAIITFYFALIAVWMAALLDNWLDIKRTPRALLFFSDFTLMLFVFGCWTIVQYRWIRVTLPEVACYLERILMGLTPLIALPSIFATCVATIGSKNAAFPFAIILCVLHRLFYTKKPSSFVRVSVKAHPRFYHLGLATHREECLLFTSLVVTTPFLSYFWLHEYLDWSQQFVYHVLNLAGLIGIPFLYVTSNLRSTFWSFYPIVPQSAVQEENADGEDDDDDDDDEKLALAREQNRTIFNTVFKQLRGYRLLLAVASYVTVLHCAVYRLTHSRLAYLFVGVPPPYNSVLLAVIGYSLSLVAILIYRLQLSRNASKNTPAVKTGYWISVILLSVFSAVSFGIVAGMPHFFLPMSALCVTCFNAFLLDRRQLNNYGIFVCCSVILLLWWMYKTFSFIRMELHVFGEGSTVSTQVLAVSVIWAYIFGAISFPLSMARNKSYLAVTLVVLAGKIGWIEHVLYSQHESSAYSTFYVILTTVVGVFTAYRLHKNEVLQPETWPLVAGAFISKLASLLYEVTAAHFAEQGEDHWMEGASGSENKATIIHIIESLAAWFTCWLIVSFIIVLEEERRAKKKREKPHHFTILTLCVLLFNFANRNTLWRFVLEYVFHTPFVGGFREYGAVLFFSGLMFFPIAQRFAATTWPRYAKLATLFLFSGFALIVADPSLEILFGADENESVMLTDIPFAPSMFSRWACLFSVLLLGIARFIPFQRLPSRAFRIAYWLVTSVFGSIGVVGQIVVAADLPVYLGLCILFAMFAATIEDIHYGTTEEYICWVTYGCGIFAMAASYVFLSNVDLSGLSSLEIFVWEAHTMSRIGLLALTGVVNVGVGALIKFRLTGHPLLSGCTPLTPKLVQNAGVICNYATLLGSVILILLNFVGGENDPLLYIVSSCFLLLLHDDEMLFADLGNGYFRYFPTLLVMASCLWGEFLVELYGSLRVSMNLASGSNNNNGAEVNALDEKYSSSSTTASPPHLTPSSSAHHTPSSWNGTSKCVFSLFFAAWTLPSTLSHLRLLYFGKRQGGSRKKWVSIFIGLDVLVFLIHSATAVKWLAIVNLASHACRLYAGEIWNRRQDPLL